MVKNNNKEDLLNNFIPLSRGLFDHYLWIEDREYSKFEAWLYLIKEARFKTSRVFDRGIVVVVERGQVYASLSFLSNAFGWSIKRVRTFLALLENDGMITRHSHKDSGQSVITILNYDKFNIGEKKKETAKNADDWSHCVSNANDKVVNIGKFGKSIQVNGEEKYIHDNLYEIYNEIQRSDDHLYLVYRNTNIF